jgi:diguanylate cyclase (GGDEF)-like protein
MFATLPEEVMFRSVRKKIEIAFDNMKGHHLANVIDLDVGGEMQILVDSYNDMVKVLDHHQKEREQAQKKALEAQRILNEELEIQVKARTVELQKLNDDLAIQAQTDSLTGISNRRHFFQCATEYLKLSKREKMATSILMIDIDYFKSVNDTHGHDVGDLVIKSLAQEVSSLLRNSDMFARFGGEEFVVLAPNTEITGALILAEKIRHIVKNFEGIENVKITVSLGVAELLNYDLEDAIKKSDLALYKAKKNGRNRVECYGNINKQCQY